MYILQSKLSNKYAFWIVISIVLAIFLEFSPLAPVEGLLFDWRAKYITARGDLDPQLVIAGIDEGAMSGNPRFHVKGLGRWPWPRQILAGFLEKTKEAGVKLVVFDVLFQDEEPGDKLFAQALSKGPPVILAEEIKGSLFANEEQTLYPPRKIFLENAKATGYINAALTQSTVHSVSLATQLKPGGPYIPSLALATVQYLLGNPPLRATSHEIFLGDQRWETSGSEHELLLRWVQPASVYGSIETEKEVGPHNYISILDMFLNANSTNWKNYLKGKVLLVGAADPSLQDEARTPVGLRYGVAIHANAINALLHDQYEKYVGQGWNWAVLLLPSLLLAQLLKRTNAFSGALLTVLFVFLYTIANIFLFASGWWFHLAGPCVAMIFVYTGGTAFRSLEAERKKNEISKIYGRYLAPQIRKELMKNYEAQKAELLGALREVTILESDIRGFTHLSENLAPEEVVRLLNAYFTAMMPILSKHGGTWDKFIGDALLAYFGAPGHQPDHAARAVSCAIEMLQVLQRMREKGDIPFNVGIGLNTGVVNIGHIGAGATGSSDEQKQFTIIGDAVNLAARLCGQAEGGSVLLSEATFAAAHAEVNAEPLTPITVKGKAAPVNVYRIHPDQKP